MPHPNNSGSGYLDPYRKAVEDMGAGFEAQLWVSKDAQRTRFGALVDALGMGTDNAPKVIADLGCGQGDLLVYLHECGLLPTRFIGIEGVEEMTVHARSRIEDLGIESDDRIDSVIFETHDFVADGELARTLVEDGGVDAFVFSGSLNTLTMEHAQSVLLPFFEALVESGRGKLVFNFLSTHHDRDRTPASPPAVRFDPTKMLGWALEQTPLVNLRHAYLRGHDATITMEVSRAF